LPFLPFHVVFAALSPSLISPFQPTTAAVLLVAIVLVLVSFAVTILSLSLVYPPELALLNTSRFFRYS
jgi:hypothetical protein